jgi:hypothetical protein
MAIDLPPVSPAVYLVASNFGAGISEEYLRCYPSGINREWYVCMYYLNKIVFLPHT